MAAEAQQETNILLLAEACSDLLFIKDAAAKTPLDLMCEEHFQLVKTKVKAGVIPRPAGWSV